MNVHGSAVGVLGLLLLPVILAVVIGLVFFARRRHGSRSTAGRTIGFLISAVFCLALLGAVSAFFLSASPARRVTAERIRVMETEQAYTLATIERGCTADAGTRDDAGEATSYPTFDATVRVPDPDDVDTLTFQSCTSSEVIQHSTIVSQITGLSGISVLIVLAYLFVDAGRRRRYTWLVRTTAAAAFIAVCVLIAEVYPLM